MKTCINQGLARQDVTSLFYHRPQIRLKHMQNDPHWHEDELKIEIEPNGDVMLWQP